MWCVHSEACLRQSAEMGQQQRRLHMLAPGSSQHLKAVSVVKDRLSRIYVQFIIS